MRSILVLSALLLVPGVRVTARTAADAAGRLGANEHQPRGRALPVSGLLLFVQSRGPGRADGLHGRGADGPPNGRSVVLLHGMNFFGEAWTSTIDFLRKAGYRVVAADQIGYGRSSKPILHYSISTHASNTKRLLDHLGVKTADIVTHSMGGMVASRFASSYPDAVGNLALINQIGLTDARAPAPGETRRRCTRLHWRAITPRSSAGCARTTSTGNPST